MCSCLAPAWSQMEKCLDGKILLERLDKTGLHIMPVSWCIAESVLGFFFLLFGMHAPKLAPHLWIRYKRGRQVLSSFHPSLHPLHFLPPRRCICILSSSCQCLTDTCTNPHSHLLRAVISMLTLCLRQHVFLPHCWPLVFMSVKHMQEC